MEKVKLAFCGASGTGKSTLATAAADRLGLALCPIGSREVSAAMGFSSPYDVDAAGKRAQFQRELLTQKHAWEQASGAAGFVSDRTHFDNLTYATMHAPEVAEDSRFVESVLAASWDYTHIVLCPMSSVHEVGDDPARRKESDYHEEYERILVNLILDLAGPMPVLILTSCDRDERLRQVLRFVSP